MKRIWRGRKEEEKNKVTSWHWEVSGQCYASVTFLLGEVASIADCKGQSCVCCNNVHAFMLTNVVFRWFIVALATDCTAVVNEMLKTKRYDLINNGDYN
jgi:hypothetical protein